MSSLIMMSPSESRPYESDCWRLFFGVMVLVFIDHFVCCSMVLSLSDDDDFMISSY